MRGASVLLLTYFFMHRACRCSRCRTPGHSAWNPGSQTPMHPSAETPAAATPGPWDGSGYTTPGELHFSFPFR